MKYPVLLENTEAKGLGRILQLGRALIFPSSSDLCGLELKPIKWMQFSAALSAFP